MITALLVGGPCDGERMAVPHRLPVLQRAMLPADRPILEEEPTLEDRAVPCEILTYHLMVTAGLPETLAVYRHALLPAGQVLPALLAGYRQPSTERVG